MQSFSYARATSVADALAAGATERTAFLAGGTELLNWRRLGVSAPERLLDISRLEGLDAIETTATGAVLIGALARLNDVAQHEHIRRDYPVLSQALLKAASPQLRNLATIGGNPLQKTRCAYFRAEEALPCNKRAPGSGCSALHGSNDKHAIFGWSEHCVATQPSDPAVALAALDALYVTEHRDGGRRIPATELHSLPDDPQQHGKGLAMCNFGVVFVEVGVDPELGLLRLRRAVGSYSVGRIINARTAKAQMTGGIVWGWGMAAMEQSPFDTTLGRFVSKNLAGVAIPVNADIPADITIHFVDEVDEHASPIGARGIGELGATGVAAAVANAVFHATGNAFAICR
jgi:CO/xanthine dehydrogenase FAD-binding subunit